ncbi:fimbrial assembly protein [Diaphorobacter ruginosibacter]|uniref:fimbrial assembly protein n=1 Tax=Diaphorobacter ruginosibacter TaxID=1715720 RepID=UPI0033427449
MNSHPSSSSLRGRGSRQRGAALIESLVAVLLFSLGVLGLIGLQTRAIGMAGEADERNRAALLADAAAASMWQANSITLASDALQAWKDEVAGQLPNGTGSITAVGGVDRTADVEITWRMPSRASDDVNRLTTRVTLTGPDF